MLSDSVVGLEGFTGWKRFSPHNHIVLYRNSANHDAYRWNHGRYPHILILLVRNYHEVWRSKSKQHILQFRVSVQKLRQFSALPLVIDDFSTETRSAKGATSRSSSVRARCLARTIIKSLSRRCHSLDADQLRNSMHGEFAQSRLAQIVKLPNAGIC